MEIDDRERIAHTMSQRIHFVGKGWTRGGIEWCLAQLSERYTASQHWEVTVQFVKVEVTDIQELERMRLEAKSVMDSLSPDDLKDVIKQFKSTSSL